MIGERKSRLCLADVRGGEMNAWQTNPKGRLRGGYMGWEFQQITELWIRVVYLRAKCQKRLSVIRKKQRRIKKTSKTYMWQFVNRRAHQRWNIALHATTKRTSASKSLKFTYSSQHMKHKIVPSFLLLKLLYNLPYQHNVSTSMGQNLSPTFSVPPWL